ncbi:MAG TPA: response regulator transcription factor [Thermoleophilaceae bacterium]|nr:response regulator transcription factor [Thermoleophilaceae bacterium]
MIRVLIADDQELVRAGFAAILGAESDIDVVGEALDGLEVLELARRLRPEVVLMDVRMPNMDGLEATRHLLAEPRPPRVLVLTTFDLDEYVYEAMKAGASGFLLKDVPRDQLTAGVRMVARGESLLAPRITKRLIERFVAHAPAEITKPQELAELSERELDVLRLLADGLSNEEIGERLFISRATVKTHVANVLAKLGVRDRVQAVVFAYESGLVQRGSSG